MTAQATAMLMTVRAMMTDNYYRYSDVFIIIIVIIIFLIKRGCR